MTTRAKLILILLAVVLAATTFWWWPPARCAVFKEHCLLESCRAEVQPQEAACEATPSTTPASRTGREGYCKLRLSAAKGYFFPDKHIRILEENYEGIPGRSAGTVESIRGANDRETGASYISALNSRTGCTTAPNAKTECRARAHISADTYPVKCLPVKQKLVSKRNAST